MNRKKHDIRKNNTKEDEDMIYNLGGSLKQTAKTIIKSFVFISVKLITYIFPRNKNMIVFSSWFGKKYADSPMYLFEYAERNSSFMVYWYTKDRSIYEELKKTRRNILYGYSIKALYIHVRAAVFVSSNQFSDFISTLLSGANLLDLDHGIPNKFVFFKDPLYKEEWKRNQYQIRKYVNLFLLATNYRLMKVYHECYDLAENRIALGNKPRTDALFDSVSRGKRNSQIDEIVNGRKTIVYMPTHRSEGKKTLKCKSLLDLDTIQKLCEKYNFTFIIKKHFYHNQEKEDLSKYPSIIDITNMSNLDPEVLLYQTDVLISDYSSVYIDYLLLDRPILLFVFDEEDFIENERDMYIKLADNNAGYKVRSKDEMTEKIELIAKDNWKDTVHRIGRRELRDLYFDRRIINGNACENSVKIIQSIANGTFSIEWKE